MDIVKNEIKNLILPIAMLSILEWTIFFILGNTAVDVLISIILGDVYILTNFYMIGCAVKNSLYKPPGRAQGYMTSQYIFRYVFTGIIIFLSFKIDHLNTLALLFPMFFPKLILVINSLKEGG